MSWLTLLSGVGGVLIGIAATLAARSSRLGTVPRAIARVPEADPTPAAEARAESLHRLAAALSRAASPHEVGMAFLDQALERLGAQGGSLVLRSADGSALELIAGRDLPGAKASLLERVPIEESFSVTEAYRTGRPVAARTHTEFRARFPTSARTFGERAQAIYALPLSVNGEAAGAFNLFFDHEHEVSATDADFLATMAQLCGQALERALLADAESRARERAEETARYATSLYSLGMRLASAVTPLDVATTVMREAIAQHGAAAAAIGLIDDQRRGVELLADDGYPPAALAVLRRFSLDAPIPAAAAARTSAPVLVGTLAERQARFPRLPKALGDGSLAIACLPLRIAERTFGVLILRYTGERAFASDERRFLLTLADDCSLALDRARLHAETVRLYEREHHIAETLQASLLPSTFPPAPGLDFAAFFAPMGDGNEVGGDFFDVFPKGRGYTVVVGDVCGKGPEAAKLTALCRYTLRAAGMLADTDPSGTLALLNRAILEQAHDTQFCTVVIADLAPTANQTMRATISTSGHPAPLIIRHTGTVEALPVRGTILGVVEEPMLVDTAVELAAGDAIMFLTDGVEEARRDDGEFYGDVRICTAIERAARAPIGVSAASLVDAVRADLDAFRGDQSARDDIVILAVRHENPDLRPSERPHSRQDICELPVSVDDGQTT